MNKKERPEELNDGRLADYPAGYDPATRITAAIQETWEIHPPESDKTEKRKKTGGSV